MLILHTNQQKPSRFSNEIQSILYAIKFENGYFENEVNFNF